MSFGPELVWVWGKYLAQFTARRVQKIDGGDSWIAVSLSGGIVLLLSWGAQNCGIAHINEKTKKTLLASAKQTPPITNALKSNLAGAELTEISQMNRDRIIKLTFTKTLGAGFAAKKHLILEMMERYSNLILSDDNGIVLEAAKHVHPSENRFRSILPGQPYAMPPEFKGILLEDWLRSPSSSDLKKIAGFGKNLLNILSSINIYEAAACLEVFYAGPMPENIIPQKIGKYLTALPMLIDGAVTTDGTGIDDTGRAAVLDPLLNSSVGSSRKKLSDSIEHEITRRLRQIEDINRLLSEENAEKYKHYGDVLVSNAWQIKAGSSEAEVCYWDNSGCEQKENIPLNPALMPIKNAAVYYAKYKKITAAQERAAKLLDKVAIELDELKEQRDMVLCADDPETLALIEEEIGLNKASVPKTRKKKGAVHLPPHKRFDLGFALVYAGLSSKGNRYVTFNLATPEDIWFHAQGIPGSHVILRYNYDPSEEERDTAVEFCASLAVYFSKARGNNIQRVDYTKRKYVSAIRGGEANVTYREFQSVTADAGFWQEYMERIE